MDFLNQKVAYLKGLADGLEIDEKSKEGKLLLHIIDALEDFADAIEEVVEDQIELEDFVSYIDEDLSDVEDDIYGDEGIFSFDEDDDDLDFWEWDDEEGCCDDPNCDCHYTDLGIDEFMEDEE